jgi:penicillin-binding protein 1A
MKWLKRFLKFSLYLAMLGVMAGVTALLLAYIILGPDLPSTENLREIKLQVPLRVYSQDGGLIAEFGEKRRSPINFSEVPEKMVHAFLAAEDDRFFNHPGVDYQGIIRAGIELVLTGERRQGGSTITMQVARNYYLTPEKTFTRKISEILLALQIERELSKEEILELYLNKIYLGNRAYGIGAAAELYYDKSLDQLNLPQIAMIAGLPKAPSRSNPIANPERALERREYVLDRMLDNDFITEEQYEQAAKAPITAKLHASHTDVEAPYIAEMVRAEMAKLFGEEAAYTGGYNVYTTIDGTLQAAANSGVRKALQEYDQRHGYRGAENQVDLAAHTDQEAWNKLLKQAGVVGDLIPGLVLSVEEKQALVHIGQDKPLILSWEGLQWARPYVNENHSGSEPKSASEILQPGDIIRLTEMSTEEGEKIWRLAQIPAAEGALVSVLPDDGAVVALVGGYDYHHSKFNRATQAKRQPGSGFKAFIYSAALEAGFTAASIINDAPVVINDAGLEATWRPENYSGKFFGPTRLRYALTKSRNLVSIRLLRAMGIDHALKHVERFGFNTEELPRNLSLALGSGSVSPMQMARGYSILANGGYRIEPYFIARIEDSNGHTIYRASPLKVCPECETKLAKNVDTSPPEISIQAAERPPEFQTAEEETPADNEGAPEQSIPESTPSPRIAPRVITAQNHYLMNSMMRDVIQRGTATKARSLGRTDLAGKTGTTNEQRDAWFNGFHRSLVAITWVGFDSSAPLGRGEVGGRAALPAWINFMETALQDVPEHPLEKPAGVVSVRIDPRTGARAASGQKDAIFEVFRAGNIPEEGGPSMDIGEPFGDGGATPGEQGSSGGDLF